MRNIIFFASGFIFGLGLAISTMVKPEVILSFLRLEDFGLMIVLLSAVLLLWVGIYVFKGKKAHITGETRKTRHTDITPRVIIGGILFGAGWGISGVCPGAAYASLGVGNFPIIYAIIAMFVGAVLAKLMLQKLNLEKS